MAPPRGGSHSDPEKIKETVLVLVYAHQIIRLLVGTFWAIMHSLKISSPVLHPATREHASQAHVWNRSPV